MKKFLTLCLLIGFSAVVSAQKMKSKKTSTPTAKVTWKRYANVALYAAQAGSRNWASGTEPFALSGNAFLNAELNRTAGRWFWNNKFIASFGMQNSKNLGFRKNDDKMDYFSTLGWTMKNVPTLSWAGAFNFTSQFWKGYDHDYLNQGITRRTSGFFAPAVITVAPVGLLWAPAKCMGGVKFFFGAAARGVIVSNAPYSYAFQGGVIPANLVNEKNPSAMETSVAAMYGVDPGKTIRYEGGPYLSATYNKEVVKNVTLNGRLDLFSDFYNNEGANLDFLMLNTFNFKINKWLSAVYSLDLAYDDNVRKFGYYKNKTGFQVKTILGVGINAKLK